MKITPSVLVAEMRGKAGPVVASSWKGRQYVRSFKIPSNPQTLLQRTQRWAQKVCVKMWQGLSTLMQASWVTVAASDSVSTFNAFCGANVPQEASGDAEQLSPANPNVKPIGVLTAVTGALAGEIDITWTAGEAAATDDIVIAYRETENVVPADVASTEAVALTYDEATGKVVSDGAVGMTISGLTVATEYVIYILASDPVDGYSISKIDVATSHA